MKRYDPKIWRISANNRAFHKLETTPPRFSPPETFQRPETMMKRN